MKKEEIDKILNDSLKNVQNNVKTISQDLAENKKKIARRNIGAVSVKDGVIIDSENNPVNFHTTADQVTVTYEGIETNVQDALTTAGQAIKTEHERAIAAEGELLSVNKFLPFSAFNVDPDVTLQMSSTIRSGESIFYIQKHNVFAIEKNGFYYPAWETSEDPTESLKYNKGNETVGYTAREDNVYISTGDKMYRIINGTLTLLLDFVGTLSTQVEELSEKVESLVSKDITWTEVQ